jgi:hypothetical protein
MKVPYSRLGLIAVLLAAGCNKNSAVPSASGKAPVVSVDQAKSGGATSSTPSDTRAAQAEANEFLNLLTAGNAKAAVDRVAVSFRKLHSGPLTFEEERKVGYSDSDTAKYLAGVSSGATKAEITNSQPSPDGNAVSFRGKLVGNPGRLFSLRMAKDGDAWKVSRFIAGAFKGTGHSTGGSDAELAWARETALDFLDALIGGSDEQTPTLPLMADEFKAKLPSPSVHDEGLTYAKKDVRAWLNAARGGVDGYVMTGESRTPQGYAFAGSLAAGMRNRSFTLFLARRGDEWKIDGFEVNQ